MAELTMTLVLIGVLAVVALPRMRASVGLAGSAWREQVAAALLHGRTLAIGHRRLVCASLATGEVRLTLALAHPATSCTQPINGIDGDARWAHDGSGLALSVTPAGTLYLQPDGRITSDGAGSTPVNVSIAISGERSIAITGETGHVD